MHREGIKELAIYTFGLPCMGCLQEMGKEWVHLESSGTSCTVTASFLVPPFLVSKLVFVAGEERHGRGSAVLHQEPQTRPQSKGTECTQTENHTLWLGEAPGELSHYIV